MNKTDWELAYSIAYDLLSEIPHPMAENAIEYLDKEYGEEN